MHSDDDNRSLVEVSVAADVEVTCQRCLEPMPLHVEAGNALAVVWNDEYARQLPKDLDPLIVGEEPCNLWELVEEELMLGLPAFSYHEDEHCNDFLAEINEPPAEDEAVADKPNPFNVLAQLKPGHKH